MTPTKAQIAAEIKMLRRLKPHGQWKNKTQRSILCAIEELEEAFDRTASEWWELTSEEQDLRNQVQNWLETGEEEFRPSQGWSPLAE